MRRRTAPGVLAVVLVLGVVALVAWAWRDGGRSPVRDIVVPVQVPELPQ